MSTCLLLMFAYHCLFVYMIIFILFFFFKQKTAYEMRISDWSSDVCSSRSTTSGVRVPNVDWISDNREGLIICDATSSIFAMDMDWKKIGRASCRERVCQYV